MKKNIILKPYTEPLRQIALLEKRILAELRSQLYAPLLKLIGVPKKRLKNARSSPLLDALEAGKITYSRGVFTGSFSAAISRDLTKLGAKWDRREKCYRLALDRVPSSVLAPIRASQNIFKAKVDALGRTLGSLDSAQIARSIKTVDLFKSSLAHVHGQVQGQLKSIGIVPKLSESQKLRIAERWKENLELDIKTWTDQEVLKLRRTVDPTVMKGLRYDTLAKHIERAYGVGKNKAKFFARQETNLMTAQIAQTAYEDAGVTEYKWQCVSGSEAHPVRPRHRELDGTIHSWNNPPITTEPGQPARRNNPRQDYNCRCVARPIVRL